jgi:glutathione S-transferase
MVNTSICIGVQAYEAMIFHITDTATWAASQERGSHTGSTRGIDLAEEGYIHCSTAAQWPGVVERSYADASNLLLLHIEEAQLTSPLVYEQLPGMPEAFPHVYGPINLDAVITTQRLAPLGR